MKRDAVIGQTIGVALTTAAVGVACFAAPVRADDASKMALAPLPQVSSPGTLFPKKAAAPAPKADNAKKANNATTKLRDSEHGDGGGGTVEDPTDVFRVGLKDQPVAYVVGKGLAFRNLMPNHPNGFPSDHYSYRLAPVVGIGGGTEISAAWTGAEGRTTFLPDESFYGAGIQKRLINEGHGFMPTVSVGVMGNVGPQDHNSLTGYLVGSKRVLGHSSKKKGGGGFPGLWLTGGYKYQSYDTHDLRALVLLAANGRAPEEEASGARPFGGINLALNKHLFASAEVQQRQGFERDNPFCVRGLLVVSHGFGVEGGIRNVGYISHGYVSLVFGGISSLLHHGH